MDKLANIEGEEIVIRVPVSALIQAAPYAWDRWYGKHSIAVEDATLFAKELVLALNAEAENGDTLVHKMLDRACYDAAERGAEGLSA